MSFDQREYRNALGRFATGVAIATALDSEGEPLGMTINSFGSVSLEPPLVLWCLDREARSRDGFRTCRAFAINVLGEGEEAFSERFAEPGSEKWRGLRTAVWETGCPILPRAIAVFECRTREVLGSGDHEILLGEVVRYSYLPEARPLVFFEGGYRRLSSGSAG